MTTSSNKKNGTNPRQNLQESLTMFTKKEDKRVAKLALKCYSRKEDTGASGDDGVGKEKGFRWGAERMIWA